MIPMRSPKSATSKRPTQSQKNRKRMKIHAIQKSRRSRERKKTIPQK